MKRILKRVAAPSSAALLLGVALAGCGGGSSNNNSTPQNVAAANMVALQSGNVLSLFDARTPYTVQTRTVSGLNSGEQLIGIDYRFAPVAAATTGAGLYGLVRSSTSARLVTLNLSGTTAVATGVGNGFTLPFTSSNIGFDFNPLVDRLRVVDSVSGANLRLNPDTGGLVDSDANTAGTQFDGNVAYDTTDAGNGTTPRLVGAAYTNNFAGTTGTINYAIDSARGALVTQGRPANGSAASVSPNTGRLFTVGLLGTKPGTGGAGFDIGPGQTNNAFVAFSSSSGRARLYALDLASGTLSGGAEIRSSADRPVLGIAILP